jgi:hypothetical protein
MSGLEDPPTPALLRRASRWGKFSETKETAVEMEAGEVTSSSRGVRDDAAEGLDVVRVETAVAACWRVRALTITW